MIPADRVSAQAPPKAKAMKADRAGVDKIVAKWLESSRVYTATLVLIALGIVLSFPPVWQIFA